MSADKIEIIVKVAIAIGSFLLAAVPSVIALIKSIKDKKVAQHDAAVEAAENEMTSQMYNLIEAAEKLYANLDAALKKDGGSAGELKKDKVLMGLSDYAEKNDYEFDKDLWSDKIDEAVYLTRTVNVRR